MKNQNAELVAKLRETADALEKRPEPQAALGGGAFGGLLRKILDMILAELLGLGQPAQEPKK